MVDVAVLFATHESTKRVGVIVYMSATDEDAVVIQSQACVATADGDDKVFASTPSAPFAIFIPIKGRYAAAQGRTRALRRVSRTSPRECTVHRLNRNYVHSM